MKERTLHRANEKIEKLEKIDKGSLSPKILRHTKHISSHEFKHHLNGNNVLHTDKDININYLQTEGGENLYNNSMIKKLVKNKGVVFPYELKAEFQHPGSASQNRKKSPLLEREKNNSIKKYVQDLSLLSYKMGKIVNMRVAEKRLKGREKEKDSILTNMKDKGERESGSSRPQHTKNVISLGGKKLNFTICDDHQPLKDFVIKNMK